MAKKSGKVKIQGSSNIEEDVKASSKRKKKFAAHPPAKRTKMHTENDDGDSAVYSERFKYILAPKTEKQQQNGNGESSKQSKSAKKTDESKSKKKVESKPIYGHNGKANLMSLYDYEEDESSDDDWKMNDHPTSESDSSLLDEDLESYSEESFEEEWETDTDYSFHQSDCESVHEETTDDEECELGYNSSDDNDYVPPIQDKYVKKGDAVMYAAKGLDLAFGDTSECQIVEINDVDAHVEMASDEEIPPLVPMNSDQTEEESFTTDPTINLNLDEDEIVKSSMLLKHATFYNCSNEQGVVVKLNAKIHFHGILVIRPLINNIQINGFILNANESLTATSISRTDYFLNITPIIDENFIFNKSDVCHDLKKILDPSYDAEEIINNFDSKTEVLLYLQQSLPDSTIATLQTYLPHPILPHKNMILNDSACPSSELILRTKFFVDTWNPKLAGFKINEDWKYIEMKTDQKLMVIGGKNVGKSALSQYLINKNISMFQKILLIDLDIGQPIISSCQTVSATLITKPLIGAGYLSDLTPDKSFLFGSLSVMVNPFKYLKCIMSLLKFCNENDDYKNIPWVINTMGYQKGFGLQLMCILMRIVQPTEIVQIQHSNPKFNFHSILKSEFVNDFNCTFFSQQFLQEIQSSVDYVTHVLDSIVNIDNIENKNGKWVSNASEKRKISLIAQMGKLMKGGQRYLNDVVPFSASIDSMKMVVIDEEYNSQDRDINLDLFNGNLVYLCHHNETADSTECFGFGIVRAIDKIHGKMYIILPESKDARKLKTDVNMLAIGSVSLPAEITLKQNFGITGNVPHVTFFKERGMAHKKYINKRHIKDCF